MNGLTKIRVHLYRSQYPGLTRTLLIYIQIGIRPKGLHNFTFYILHFDFPSHFPLMSLLADTYVPYKSLYKCREFSITIEESLQIAPFFAKQTQFPKSPNERKLIFNKGLQKYLPLWSPKKQTQFKPNSKPNKPNLPEARNEPNLSINKGL